MTGIPRRTPRKQSVLNKMDALASSLLTHAKDKDDIETSLSILRAVSAWIAVRNKVEEAPDNGGTSLDGFKRELARAREASGRKNPAGRQRGPDPYASATGGVGAEWQHSGLPGANGRDSGRDGGSGTGEVSIATGGRRSVRVGLSEPDEPGADDDRDDGDL